MQTWSLTRGMDAEGVEQTVLTSYIPGSPRTASRLRAVDIRCVGISLPLRLAGLLLNFTWFLGVLPQLYRAHRRFDLVHIHFNHSVWCRVIAMMVGLTRMPLIISTNTALWGGLRSVLRLEGSLFDVPNWIERRALRSADRVAALTDGAARRMVSEMRLDPRTVVIIPDAIEVSEFAVPPGAEALRGFRVIHGVPDGKRVVAYVGRISAEKGWADLPEVATDLARCNAFLLICGDGPDRERLERAFAAQGRGEGWKITGFLSPEEVKCALAIADVLILPSRREAFGSVLLEAMATGVPAVAYAAGGIPDVAGHPSAVLLAAEGDREAFQAAIRILLDTPVRREEMIRRGHERVLDFSLATAVEKAMAVYLELLGGAQDPSRSATSEATSRAA